MTFTLWLSADEERILERIMRAEGIHSKQQAVIAVLHEKGAKLTAERQTGSVTIDDRPGDRRAP